MRKEPHKKNECNTELMRGTSIPLSYCSTYIHTYIRRVRHLAVNAYLVRPPRLTSYVKTTGISHGTSRMTLHYMRNMHHTEQQRGYTLYLQ